MIHPVVAFWNFLHDLVQLLAVGVVAHWPLVVVAMLGVIGGTLAFIHGRQVGHDEAAYSAREAYDNGWQDCADGVEAIERETDARAEAARNATQQTANLGGLIGEATSHPVIKTWQS